MTAYDYLETDPTILDLTILLHIFCTHGAMPDQAGPAR